MSFEVTILGSGSAVPTLLRNPTAQLVNIQETYLLIDCGEGTQLQIRKFGKKLQKVSHIFISHLHGDHYLGLPGLLQTLHLLGRTKTITIYGPAPLQGLLEAHFAVGHSQLRFPIEYVVTSNKGKNLLLNAKHFQVYSVPLKHKVPTTGFLIQEKEKLRNVRKSAIIKHDIPTFWMQRIKEGKDFVKEDGEVIPNEEITLPPETTKSYAYCSDTAYLETLIPNIDSVTVLYHEASFANTLKDRAIATQHSTAEEAGTIAKKAKVGKLIIGHFSARYKDETECLEEAKKVFKNTEAAYDGMSFEVV